MKKICTLIFAITLPLQAPADSKRIVTFLGDVASGVADRKGSPSNKLIFSAASSLLGSMGSSEDSVSSMLGDTRFEIPGELISKGGAVIDSISSFSSLLPHQPSFGASSGFVPKVERVSTFLGQVASGVADRKGSLLPRELVHEVTVNSSNISKYLGISKNGVAAVKAISDYLLQRILSFIDEEEEAEIRELLQGFDIKEEGALKDLISAIDINIASEFPCVPGCNPISRESFIHCELSKRRQNLIKFLKEKYIRFYYKGKCITIRGGTCSLIGENFTNYDIDIICNELSKYYVCKLDLSGNKLTSIPNNISLLTNLECLNVSSNPIKKITFVVASLKKLKRIFFSNTPLTTMYRGNAFSKAETYHLKKQLAKDERQYLKEQIAFFRVVWKLTGSSSLASDLANIWFPSRYATIGDFLKRMAKPLTGKEVKNSINIFWKKSLSSDKNRHCSNCTIL